MCNNLNVPVGQDDVLGDVLSGLDRRRRGSPVWRERPSLRLLDGELHDGPRLFIVTEDLFRPPRFFRLRRT